MAGFFRNRMLTVGDASNPAKRFHFRGSAAWSVLWIAELWPLKRCCLPLWKECFGAVVFTVAEFWNHRGQKCSLISSLAESRAKNSSPVRLPDANVGQSNPTAETEQRKHFKMFLGLVMLCCFYCFRCKACHCRSWWQLAQGRKIKPWSSILVWACLTFENYSSIPTFSCLQTVVLISQIHFLLASFKKKQSFIVKTAISPLLP